MSFGEYLARVGTRTVSFQVSSSSWGGSWLLATTDCLVDNAISLGPPVYERTITLPVWMAKLLSKTEIKIKVIIHVGDVGDMEYEDYVLNVMDVEDVGDVHCKYNVLSVIYVGDVGDSVKYLQYSLLNKQWLIDGRSMRLRSHFTKPKMQCPLHLRQEGFTVTLLVKHFARIHHFINFGSLFLPCRQRWLTYIKSFANIYSF